MKADDNVLARGNRVSLVVPTTQQMAEFIEKAKASKKLHASWTQAPSDEKEYLAYLARINNDNQFGTFIKLNTTNELIGVININEIVKGAFKSGYLGYYLFSGSDKQGFMREALELLVNYAFDSLQLHRLEANIQPGNINSLRLIHNSGFVKEGFSRKYLCINNQWQDHVRYALTKEMRKKSNESGKLILSHLKKENIPEIVKQFNKAKINKTIAVFDEYFEEQKQHKRLIWLAQLNNRYVGYVTLVWDSYYKPFSEKNIPEIKDLNVINGCQRQGIGTALLLAAEKEAFKRSTTVGLGVGLYEDYGNAQSLYFKLGYCPDGNGITYNYKKVPPGKTATVDDDLCLWLTKNITGVGYNGQ